MTNVLGRLLLVIVNIGVRITGAVVIEMRSVETATSIKKAIMTNIESLAADHTVTVTRIASETGTETGIGRKTAARIAAVIVAKTAIIATVRVLQPYRHQ